MGKNKSLSSINTLPRLEHVSCIIFLFNASLSLQEQNRLLMLPYLRILYVVVCLTARVRCFPTTFDDIRTVRFFRSLYTFYRVQRDCTPRVRCFSTTFNLLFFYRVH